MKFGIQISFLFSVLSGVLFAQDRVALLIANWDYGEHPLPEARENVKVLSAALKKAGFTVTVKENIEKDFRREFESFVPTCPNGGVSLVYYCGYGSQYERRLSRTVEKPNGEKEKEYYHEPDSGLWPTKGNSPYRLEEVTNVFRQRSHARTNILILDCAYFYPKVKEEHQGLLDFELQTWPGGMVCLASPPGKFLPQGTFSALAGSLARNLVLADRSLDEVINKVRSDVSKASGGRQEIWKGFAFPVDAASTAVSSRERRVSTATNPPANPRPGDEWINGIGMVFCWCPSGEFRMGLSEVDTAYTRDAEPVDVAISEGFWISKYEVTLGDYSRARYGREKPLRGPLGYIPINVSNVPLTTVSPQGASGMLGNLNKTESKSGSLPSGWGYRLPTEAEWEYACRAGSKTRYSFGDSAKDLARHGNFADARLHDENSDFYFSDRESDDRMGARPAPIGHYTPNAWGIHDMHGNVNEICADRYDVTLPGGRDPWVDKLEKGMPERFVMKGGSWSSTAEYCQSGFRNSVGFKDNPRDFAHIGLRVVLSKRKLANKK